MLRTDLVSLLFMVVMNSSYSLTSSPSHVPSLSPTHVRTPEPSTSSPSIQPTHAPIGTYPPTITFAPSPSPTLTPLPTNLPTPPPSVLPIPSPSFPPTLSPEIVISQTMVHLAESSQTKGVAVKVWLSNLPVGDVFVSITSANGQVSLNATSKSDDDESYGVYVDDKGDDDEGFLMVGPFTPANWELPKTFIIKAIDDDKMEWTNSSEVSVQYDGQNGDDVLSLQGISDLDTRYNTLTGPSVQVFIEDNDVAGLKVNYPYLASGDADTATGEALLLKETTEGSEEASTEGFRYGISLNSKPYASVVVDMTYVFSSHPWLVANSSTAFKIFPDTMTFTTTNWHKQQRVKMLIYDDDIERLYDSYYIQTLHQSNSSDPAYTLARSTQPRVNLTVWEDDVAGVFTSTSKIYMGCDYDGNVMYGESYTLALSSQPTHAVSLYLSAFDSSTGAAATETHLSLREFFFTRSDWNIEQTLYVNATSTDLQKRSESIYHAVTSSDPVYGDSSTGVAADNSGLGPSVGVSIIINRDAIPPPKIKSSYFTATGGGAEITFDRETNKGGLSGTFDCTKLIYGAAVVNFGANAHCSWSSSTLLLITFSSDATVLPGEFFFLRDNVLASSAPNSTLYTTNTTARFQTKTTAVIPDVILNAPSVIGACDNLLVDARLTTGSGGRSFILNWTVNFLDGCEENATSFVKAAVTEANANGALYVSVAMDDVPASRMVFGLHVTNWMGNEYLGFRTVQKKNTDPPLVQISGFGSTITWRVAQDLKLTASASMPACGSGGTSTKLSYTWTEPSGYLTHSEVTALATSQPRSILIKSGVMKAGRTYVFEVVAFIAGNANSNSSAEIRIYGQASNLFATISGGSVRKQSHLDVITLDATQSYDPDMMGAIDHLEFNWICYDKTTHKSCTNSSSGDDLKLSSVSKLAVPPTTLTSGNYIIRLWLVSHSDGRNATASVDISLAATAIPEVGIDALTVSKVNNNAGTYLELGGSIIGDVSKYGTITYEWTLTSGDEPTEDSGYSSVFAVAVNRLNTVLELGALTQGSTYQFTLTAYAQQGDDDTVSGYAVVTMPVNSPPTSGTFSVTPGSGVSLTTDFLFSCASWVDDVEDLPLKYGFRSAAGMAVASSTVTHSLEQMVLSATTTTSFTTVLPEGDTTGNVSCVAYIRDRFLAATRVTTVVGVSSLVASYLGRRRRLDETDAFGEYLMDLSTGLLTASSLIGDSEGMAGIITNVASVTNSEDGGAAISASATADLLGGLVLSLTDASSSIDTSEDSVDLLMGGMGSVTNGDATRLTMDSQTSLLSLSVDLLDSANGNNRVALSATSATSACKVLAALLASDDLFGAGANFATNNSVAVSGGLNNLASGTLVNKYAGMGATETSCNGLLVSAQKLGSGDIDGTLYSVGNSTFMFPANFSRMTNLTAGATVETSSHILTTNPHRGTSSLSINTDSTSLSMLTSSPSADRSSKKFAVSNLTSPISIQLPLKSLGQNLTQDFSFNISCSGEPGYSEYHDCPIGPPINYTCVEGAAYIVSISCNLNYDHQCVFWDTVNKDYSDYGCVNAGVVQTGVDSGYITCNCTHLTDFTSHLQESSDVTFDILWSPTLVPTAQPSSTPSTSFPSSVPSQLPTSTPTPLWIGLVIAAKTSTSLNGYQSASDFDASQQLLFSTALEASLDIITNINQINITSVAEASRRRQRHRRQLLQSSTVSLTVDYTLTIYAEGATDASDVTTSLTNQLTAAFNSSSNSTSSFAASLATSASILNVSAVATVDTVATLASISATIANVVAVSTTVPSPSPSIEFQTPVPTFKPTEYIILPTSLPSSSRSESSSSSNRGTSAPRTMRITGFGLVALIMCLVGARLMWKYYQKQLYGCGTKVVPASPTELP